MFINKKGKFISCIYYKTFTNLQFYLVEAHILPQVTHKSRVFILNYFSWLMDEKLKNKNYYVWKIYLEKYRNRNIA